ncbi:hypothetical protein BXZ70DRAFT_557956 [Cristinia sonorae]|uniref:F-box domain-containing protein n=1 Tax=Cristinia sonorae TaxID=1940300 RepID=A0A8K0XL32_9AGAR|nr:hypothetical protein BXZ70DRAFT_557956 [Cristinia sonorae]
MSLSTTLNVPFPPQRIHSTMSIAKAPLTLPAELIDHTIDYLADDLECLRACTSVSWTFLRSARQHLFRKVAVNAPSEHAGQGYTPFLDFLTRTPEVCAYIHHVKFAELHSQPFPECQQYPSLCSHFLGQMLSHLPHLRTLMFEEGTYFPCQCPKDLPNTTSQPPSTNTRLHSLSLRSVRIGTRQDLSSLLRHFAEVHTLEVSDLRVQRSWDGHEGEEGRHAGEERCVEVRSLALNIAHVHDAVASKALSAALGDVLNFAALREVSFGFNHAQHIEPFGNLVSRSAKHLESLTVRLPAHPCMQIPCESYLDTSASDLKGGIDPDGDHFSGRMATSSTLVLPKPKIPGFR